MRKIRKKRLNKPNFCTKRTLNQDHLYSVSKIINPTKKKTKHYTPLLLGEMNYRLGKARFKSLRILLDSGCNSSIVLGKHTPKFRKKNTKPVHWKTQGRKFHRNYKSKV